MEGSPGSPMDWTPTAPAARVQLPDPFSSPLESMDWEPIKPYRPWAPNFALMHPHASHPVSRPVAIPRNRIRSLQEVLDARSYVPLSRAFQVPITNQLSARDPTISPKDTWNDMSTPTRIKKRNISLLGENRDPTPRVDPMPQSLARLPRENQATEYRQRQAQIRTESQMEEESTAATTTGGGGSFLMRGVNAFLSHLARIVATLDDNDQDIVTVHIERDGNKRRIVESMHVPGAWPTTPARTPIRPVQPMTNEPINHIAPQESVAPVSTFTKIYKAVTKVLYRGRPEAVIQAPATSATLSMSSENSTAPAASSYQIPANSPANVSSIGLLTSPTHLSSRQQPDQATISATTPTASSHRAILANRLSDSKKQMSSSSPRNNLRNHRRDPIARLSPRTNQNSSSSSHQNLPPQDNGTSSDTISNAIIDETRPKRREHFLDNILSYEPLPNPPPPSPNGSPKTMIERFPIRYFQPLPLKPGESFLDHIPPRASPDVNSMSPWRKMNSIKAMQQQAERTGRIPLNYFPPLYLNYKPTYNLPVRNIPEPANSTTTATNRISLNTNNQHAVTATNNITSKVEEKSISSTDGPVTAKVYHRTNDEDAMTLQSDEDSSSQIPVVKSANTNYNGSDKKSLSQTTTMKPANTNNKESDKKSLSQIPNIESTNLNNIESDEESSTPTTTVKSANINNNESDEKSTSPITTTKSAKTKNIESDEKSSPQTDTIKSANTDNIIPVSETIDHDYSELPDASPTRPNRHVHFNEEHQFMQFNKPVPRIKYYDTEGKVGETPSPYHKKDFKEWQNNKPITNSPHSESATPDRPNNLPPFPESPATRIFTPRPRPIIGSSISPSMEELIDGVEIFGLSQEAIKKIELKREAARKAAQIAADMEKKRIEEEMRKAEVERQKREEQARKDARDARRKLTIINELTPEWESKLAQAMRSKTPSSIVAGGLTRRDFGTLLPQTASDGIGWLNDEIVNTYLTKLVEKGLEETKYNKRHADSIPKYHAFSTHLYSSFTNPSKGWNTVWRWPHRAKIGDERILETEKVFIPINDHSHWTLIVISGKNRTIEYYDSMKGDPRKYTTFAMSWLSKAIPEGFWKPKEWKIIDVSSVQQANALDCGVFVCLNALALMQGRTPYTAFKNNELQMGRRMVAATIINGGFSGEFDIEIDTNHN